MKLGIMQPYFFPYLPYWQLIYCVDQYVIYDDVGFLTQGWVNRNNILVGGHPHLLSVPIRGTSFKKNICEHEFDMEHRQSRKALMCIQQSYSKAPYFFEIFPMISNFFTGNSNVAIALTNSLKLVCTYLGIQTEIKISSALQYNRNLKGQEKVLDICKELKVKQYVNAIGGRDLYDKELFRQKGIELGFLNTMPIAYKQYGSAFIANLSMIDVLMFNPPDVIRTYLSRFEIV